MRTSHSVLISRSACILLGVIAFFVTIALTCRQNTLSMLAVLGVDGFCALLWIAAACALGGVVLMTFRVRANAALFVATAGGLGLGIFSLLGLFLGLVGWLNRPVSLAIPVGSMAVWIAMLVRRPGAAAAHVEFAPVRRWLTEPAGMSFLWVIPVISLAMVCVSASILPGALWKPFDPAPYDVTSYHMQVPREWFETGRIVPLHHNMFSYFPFNVEMQFLLLMYVMGGPWMGMYACQFLCAGYFGLMVLGVAGAYESNQSERRTLNVERPTLKERGERSALNVQRSTSNDRTVLEYERLEPKTLTSQFSAMPVIGAAFAAVVPWAMMLSGVAYVESALMLYTALAIAWAIRAVPSRASTEPSGSAAGFSTASFTKPMLLTGILCGFAAGVKITAVPMLLLAVPAAIFIVMMFRRNAEYSIRRLLVGCVACVIAGSVVVSPWLVRNFIWAGNPVWPLAMNTLGRDHFSADQVIRFTKAHGPRDDQKSLAARVAVLWRDVLDHWQYGYIILPAGVLALLFRWNDRQTWIVLLTGLTIFIVWIGFTHLLARFLVMLIPLAGIAIGRVRWRSFWPIGVVLTLIAAGVSWMNLVPELMKQSAAPSDQILFGITDLSGFLSPELTEARQKQMQVALVGDAQAFFYQIPMTHLHYSTVFDLPADVTDPVQVWAGKDAVGNPDYWLIVNTSEIERLHRTYYRVPPLPERWQPRFPETFFMRADTR